MGMKSARSGGRESPLRSRAPRSLRGVTFGPVPSRRFGHSLGINNIPPKVCTYSCVYCQLGRSAEVRDRRTPFHRTDALVSEVRRRVLAARRASEAVDVLAFVPDGEPTLDLALGRSIDHLRELGIPIVVITNGSLLFHPEVREALAEADHVSVKVDTVREDTWRRINRPHGRLKLDGVLAGMRAFASGFEGTLTTETMLVEGVNEGEDELRDTAAFVADLDAATAYLTVPTRPPAEAWAVPPREAVVTRAYEVFRAFRSRVELLIGYEGDAFASTGDAIEDLLAITAVHPMREGAVRRLTTRAGVPWDAVTGLVDAGRLVQVRYGAHRYYVRALPGRPTAPQEVYRSVDRMRDL
jgi:wyosine [tRNA(Phe)-imidazoG37] synthetase (radical SAM superfamily)